MVFLANGKPSFTINAFVKWSMEEGCDVKKLDELIRSICEMYVFYKAYSKDKPLQPEEVRNLIRAFGNAKIQGTIQPDGSCPYGLWWQPVLYSTVIRYVQNITEFGEFVAKHFNYESLNPYEIRFKTDIEKWNDFKVRTKYDILAHLVPACIQTKEEWEYAPAKTGFSGKMQGRKSFPQDKIIPLIDSCPNPRDKMVFLLGGFGSLRPTEPLHTFLDDAKSIWQDTGATKLLLDHPVNGSFSYWDDQQLRNINGTRESYIRSQFSNSHLPAGHLLRDLRSRKLYMDSSHPLYVCWKGMSFTAEDPNSRFVFWIEETAGVYFHKCLKEYYQEYFLGRPKGWPYHPFLFIRLSKDGFGLPMTITALEEAFKAACDRIGVSGYSLRSLRHFYGYYAANCAGISLYDCSLYMHHANIQATKVYYQTDPLIARERLVSHLDAKRMQEQIYKRIEFPDHWKLSIEDKRKIYALSKR